MSATDELRRLLDEHDEYYKTSGNKTWWGRPIDRQTGKPINVFHYQAQPMGEDRLLVELQLATPEQAIAATLRQAVRHPKPHKKWTTVLLPEIAWSWDDSWPDYLSVAHDTHGEWRVYVPEATLGTGTCHDKNGFDVTFGFECTVCGAMTDGYMLSPADTGHYKQFNFCPMCGRRIEQ